MQRYIRELLHPKQAPKSFSTFGKEARGYQKFCFTFHLCTGWPHGRVFVSHGVCFAAAECFDYRNDVLHSYAKSEITGNLKKSICLAMSMREICENSSVPRHFLTIERGLYVFNPLRTNFGACDKFTTGRTVDLRRECSYNDHAFRFGLAPWSIIQRDKGE